MNLSHTIREPERNEVHSESELLGAVERALEAAGEEDARWHFRVLDPETSAALAWLAARRLEAEMGTEGARAAYEQWRAVPGWIAVTIMRGSVGEERERLLEACLTAVQRASLSLWSDNVPSNWVQDIFADEEMFFRLLSVTPSEEEPLGIILYGHPERGDAGL